MPARIFAVANRGLEQVSAGEMRRIPGLQVEEVSYRRITAAYGGDLARLLDLRTVDDVFLELAVWADIGPRRNSLERLKERSESLELKATIESISRLRLLSPAPPFSVTANFVGKRNYSTDEIKQAVASGIAVKYRWPYTTEDSSQLNVRVFIEHDQAYLGIRIGDKALHRRPYKNANLPGSLKPSVAAAMLLLADTRPAQWVLDPFCGAGTILIEASLSGAKSLGGDLDPQAILAAKSNADSAGVSIPLQSWDARRLPVASQAIERIVTNLPWGQQVNIETDIPAFYRNACAELGRVLKPGGQIVLLTNMPQAVQLEGLSLDSEIEISLFGMTPSILKYSYETRHPLEATGIRSVPN